MTRLAVLLCLLAAACGGGGSLCGNGRLDPGEQCDDRNDRDDDACSNSCIALGARTVALQWRILHEVVPGFDESCEGVKAATTKLHLEGPMPGDFEVDCNFSQYVISALPQGSYHVEVTLFDAAGLPVTQGMAQADFVVADSNLVVPIDIPLDDLVDTTGFHGDWFYRFKWGNSPTCAGANPPVVATRIRLEKGGQALVDAQGHAIDGMTTTPCYDFNAEFAHAVNGLPFGPATLRVTGIDADGNGRYFGVFETFVGSGISNPPLNFDVDAIGGAEADAAPVEPDAGAL